MTVAFSVDDYIEAVADDMPHELISPESLSRIRPIARLLPGAMTRFFGFECRLGQDAAEADFLVCVHAGEGSREVLAGQEQHGKLNKASRVDPVWRRARDFCAAWTDSSSGLYEEVKNMWLEFDVGECPMAIPTPSVFFGPHRAPTGDACEDGDHKWVTGKALPLLLGHALPDPVERRVADCIQRLPRGARVFQLGAMVGREPVFVRICVQGLTPESADAYLEAVGWPGPTAEARTLMADLVGRVDDVAVDFDVGEDVGPKLGLECSFAGKPQPQDEPRWPVFLDHLVDGAMCTPQKRQGLLRYPGYAHAESDPDRWPEALLKASAFMSSMSLSMIVRGLHHIKIVYEPGSPLQAKAYPCVHHLWVSRAEVSQVTAPGVSGTE